MEEEVKGDHPPANLEDAVVEFTKARVQRIAERRARIAEKITARKNAEGLGEVASVASSMELLVEDEKPNTADAGGDKSGHGHSKKLQHEKIEKDEVKKNQSAVEQLDQQIEESRKQLEQMILDGEVLITNVKVAAEYREKVRQKKQEESRKENLKRLRQEAEESQAMYDALASNWAMKAEKMLPMELYKQMKSQQESCDELLTKKDDLIIFLRREMDENDFDYEGSLEKYQKDSMLMGDRIDDLVDELRTAFIEELNLIEDYTCKNREVLLEDNQNEWMDLLQHFELMEQKNLDERKSDALAKFQILNDHFTSTKQEARQLRHKMEDDLRVLIQEREQIKYACHLNLEKVTYNLHVLKCRSKENVELKNRMKRLLLQLHDKFDTKAASLKKKMDMGKKHTEKLTKEILRLESQVDSFGQKTLHIGLLDHRKFIDLWEANEELIRDKVKSLLDSDKFVYETQLGVEYALPDISSVFESRPIEINSSLRKKVHSIVDKQNVKSNKESKGQLKENSEDEDDENSSIGVDKTITKTDDVQLACNNENPSLIIMPTSSLEFIPGPDPDPVIQRRLMKGIAKVICNQSGFIVEEELQRILEPLLETERNLVNLDAVLQALGITTVEEMQSLSRYMLRYCKVMRGVMSAFGSDVSAGMAEMNVSMTGVIGKAAYLDTGSDGTSEHSLRNISELTDSDSKECGIIDPATYCDCKTAKAQAREEAERKKKAKLKKVRAKKSRVNRDDDRRETMLSRASAYSNLQMEQVPCDVVCCSPSSPGGSILEIINAAESDKELEEILDSLDTEQEEGEKSIERGPSQDSVVDCSLKTSKATVLSWLESVDRVKMIEDLNTFNDEIGQRCDEMFEEEKVKQLQREKLAEDKKARAKAYREEEQEGEEEGEEEEEEEEEEETADDYEGDEESNKTDVESGIDQCPTQPRPRRLTAEEKRDQEKAGILTLAVIQSSVVVTKEQDSDIASEHDSRTISIHSFDSFTDSSDNFLYIDPQDVITALKNFIEDYNNRKKVVVPTLEEITSKKLARIKYPMYMQVAQYWEKIMTLLNPKGKDLWDTVQNCFDEYNKILKERNEHVLEIQKYYQNNYELGHLLQKYFQTSRSSRQPESSQWNASNMNYC